MKKQELVHALAEKEEIPISKSVKIVDSIFELISEELKNGGKVKIRRFGTFIAVDQKERTFTNPKTKKNSTLVKHKRPAFLPSRWLKEQMKSTETGDTYDE